MWQFVNRCMEKQQRRNGRVGITCRRGSITVVKLSVSRIETNKEDTLMRSNFISALMSATIIGAALSVPAIAEEESAYDLSANIGVVSDYRFRGVSLNKEKIAVQGGIDFSYALSETLSIYLGNWNSNLESSTGFGDIEVDLYGGITGSVDNLNWKLGVVGYIYPDAKDVNYYELQAEVSTTVGPVTAAFGAYLAPKQKNYGDKTGVYLYTNLSAAIPETPFTVKAGLGYEDYAFFSNKLDWNVGVSYSYKIATLSVSYVDTNRTSPYDVTKDAADATVLVSLGLAF
jgi:uncharacterized protein (TIGR02001 family)